MSEGLRRNIELKKIFTIEDTVGTEDEIKIFFRIDDWFSSAISVPSAVNPVFEKEKGNGTE
jgi:hypothetical protein